MRAKDWLPVLLFCAKFFEMIHTSVEFPFASTFLNFPGTPLDIFKKTIAETLISGKRGINSVVMSIINS